MSYSYLCILFLNIVGREQALFSSTAAFPPLPFVLVNLDDITFWKAQVTNFTSVTVQRHTLWKSNGYPERLLYTSLSIKILLKTRLLFLYPIPTTCWRFHLSHLTVAHRYSSLFISTQDTLSLFHTHYLGCDCLNATLLVRTLRDTQQL